MYFYAFWAFRYSPPPLTYCGPCQRTTSNPNLQNNSVYLHFIHLKCDGGRHSEVSEDKEIQVEQAGDRGVIDMPLILRNTQLIYFTQQYIY